MHVILSGSQRSGKSTLCRRLAEHLAAQGFKVGGIWTETVIDGEVTTLLVHDLNTGAEITLAGTDLPESGIAQGPYHFTKEGVFKAMRAIGNGMGADLMVVDEIGPLEVRMRGFYPVLNLINRAAHSLLVIRPQLIDDVLALLRLRHSYRIVTVTPESRETVFTDLAAEFVSALSESSRR